MAGDELPRSMQSLWTLLSGSLNIKSMQFIADELKERETHLVEGVLFYKKHDVKKDSLEELKKRNTRSSLTPQVLHNLSVFLNMEAEQCHQLFESYLVNEYKGTPESIKASFSNDKQLRELFENLWHFYYLERIFSLFCMKQILCNWESSNHIYGKIFKDFLLHVNVKDSLLSKLYDQLECLVSFDFETQIKYGHHFNDHFHHKLKENILKEQIEVLHLLLLFYKNFEPSIEKVIEMMQFLNHYSFRPSIESFNELTIYIGFLKSLLVVETFDLSYLYKCKQKDIEHFILKPSHEETIHKLDQIIVNLNTGIVEHSPLMLAWMMVRTLEADRFPPNEHPSQLGLKALELKVFDYLEQNILSAQVKAQSGNTVFIVIYETIANLLAVLIDVFGLERILPSNRCLGSLLIQLFTNDHIANMVFQGSLSSGLGGSLRYGLDMFPFKTHFLLSLYRSLSQTNACKNICERMCILQNLFCYCEPVNDLSLEDYFQIDAERIQSKRDRIFFNNARLLLPKDSIGVLDNIDSTRTVKWQVTRFDGWLLLHSRLRCLIDQIRTGHMYETTVANNEIILAEMTKMAMICCNFIGHNAYHGISKFHDIVRLLLESFKGTIGLKQSCSRLYLASLIELVCSIIKTHFLSTKQLWFFISDKEFFPYMIGFSNGFEEILNGADTNISSFGHILSSIESIQGNYELTFSFLSLVSQCVKKNEFLNEKTIIASFIFLARDIFPSHKLWNYRNEHDSHRIECICMQIFYDLLNRARKKSNKNEMLQVELLGTILLMEGNAAEHLLLIIKNGEKTVKATIRNSGNDWALVGDDQIVTVRTSLLVLSYLLKMYGQVCEWTGHTKKSVIEEMLFSSRSNSSPNMLLTFIHFVYQTFDIHLATNAMHLLSQLALKFPMSMLACFGANTDSIREHFLFRLETVTEDINFKISLLLFLSTCIDHQPGLVEMFLNVSNDQRGVLASIIEILKEKNEGQYFCPFELHRASLEFVSKFWLKLNMIAINLLKANDQFWKLVTFPLFPKIDETFDSSLCGFILKILSREIFYTKMLDKNPFSKQLLAVFERIKNENICTRISAQICDTIETQATTNQDDVKLIDAWKDFVSSCTKFQVVVNDSLLKQLASDALKDLMLLSSRSKDKQALKMINKLANLLLIISTNLKQFQEQDQIVPIFKEISQNMETIPFRAVIGLQCFVLSLKQTLKNAEGTEMFGHQCLILSNSFQIWSKLFPRNNDKSSSGSAVLFQEKRLVTLSLMNVVVLIKQGDISKHLNTLRHYQINELTHNIFIFLINHDIHMDLAQQLLLYFVALSHHSEGSYALHNLNLINTFLLHYNIPADFMQNNKAGHLEHSVVLNTLSAIIRIVLNMTIHLRHHFLESSISLLAIYSETFKQLCCQFRLNPQLGLAQIIVLIFKLCAKLSKFVPAWIESHPTSLSSMTEEILLTSNSVIAFLLRPNILAQSIDSASTTSKTDAVEHMQDLLNQVLFNSFHFIVGISPSLLDLFEVDALLDVSKHPLLLVANFSIPNPDSMTRLTFGALVNLINNIIKLVNKENAFSAAKIDEDIRRTRLELNVNLIEHALTILLVQTLIAKSCDDLNEMDKQLFFREINTEVNTFKTNLLAKSQKRTSERLNSISLSTHSPIGASPIKSSGVNLLDRQFIKLIFNLLENVIQ